MQVCGLDAQFLDFLVVVLAVKDVPLLGTFEDGALLAVDFLAGGRVDLGLGFQHFFQNAAHFKPDSVAVFDELDAVQLGQGVAYNVGQLVELVAAEAQT